MNDELGNRKILNSAFDFMAVRRGPTETYLLNSAMPALANAIAEAADLFEFDGRVVGETCGERGRAAARGTGSRRTGSGEIPGASGRGGELI
jgi:hypothetical protein